MKMNTQNDFTQTLRLSRRKNNKRAKIIFVHYTTDSHCKICFLIRKFDATRETIVWRNTWKFQKMSFWHAMHTKFTHFSRQLSPETHLIPSLTNVNHTTRNLHVRMFSERRKATWNIISRFSCWFFIFWSLEKISTTKNATAHYVGRPRRGHMDWKWWRLYCKLCLGEATVLSKDSIIALMKSLSSTD